MQRRLLIAEALLGSIYEFQRRSRKAHAALSGILHHSPGLQCRKCTHTLQSGNYIVQRIRIQDRLFHRIGYVIAMIDK